jgi:hypothetical protein
LKNHLETREIKKDYKEIEKRSSMRNGKETKIELNCSVEIDEMRY